MDQRAHADRFDADKNDDGEDRDRDKHTREAARTRLSIHHHEQQPYHGAVFPVRPPAAQPLRRPPHVHRELPYLCQHTLPLHWVQLLQVRREFGDELV